MDDLKPNNYYYKENGSEISIYTPGLTLHREDGHALIIYNKENIEIWYLEGKQII